MNILMICSNLCKDLITKDVGICTVRVGKSKTMNKNGFSAMEIVQYYLQYDFQNTFLKSIWYNLIKILFT